MELLTCEHRLWGLRRLASVSGPALPEVAIGGIPILPSEKLGLMHCSSPGSRETSSFSLCDADMLLIWTYPKVRRFARSATNGRSADRDSVAPALHDLQRHYQASRCAKHWLALRAAWESAQSCECHCEQLRMASLNASNAKGKHACLSGVELHWS